MGPRFSYTLLAPTHGRIVRALAETIRQRGRLLIMSKLIQPDEKAFLRRMFDPLIRDLATRTSVVFEQLHTYCNELELVLNAPVMAGGCCRSIELGKETNE